MPSSDFLLAQKPVLRRLKRVKLICFFILIVSCGTIPFFLVELDVEEQSLGIVGEVLLSSGMLPILLSLPMIAAKAVVGFRTQDEGKRIAFKRACCSDVPTFLAYLMYIIMFGTGLTMLLLGAEGRRGLIGALAEICAEVTIINSIVTLLNVPAVDDDDDIALLTTEEQQQLERTGVITHTRARTHTSAHTYTYAYILTHTHTQTRTHTHTHTRTHTHTHTGGRRAIHHRRR
jgi:hypothetical protein